MRDLNLLNQAWPNAVFGLRPRLFFLLIPYIYIFVLHRRFYERKRPYKQMGEPLYCETMRLIVAAWEGKPDSFRASVLKGMMHFVELYHGEFSEERLLRALRNIHPVDIYRIGQDDPAKLRGWTKYVFPIYTAYNGKCRKDALPMKF